ncbi:MAG: ATP-dependent sacrificial sulfur transferase LarE, partial [Propionibacteriales bacterium]|nr:ATP-dependent sacrificial sulfur transferase LarE [Propionibacteriales bacterium]
ANWVAAEQVDEYVERYRSLYPTHAIKPAELLAGARESLAAVRRAGGQTLVVTAKNAANARLHLDHLDLPVDVVVGDLWGAGKGAALREHGALMFVGDHVHDVAGARAAGTLAVAVTTGPCSAAELRSAGADVVMSSLTDFPSWFEEYVLQSRLEALTARLEELGSLVVAFSAGADSAFLVAAAVRALGADRVAAATGVSASLPAAELEAAERFCAALGVRHLSAATQEMQRPGYRANAGDRCYFCKAELVDVLSGLAEQLGVAAVATGTNADDARAGFRPGIRAAAERGAATPLLDAGLTKAQIREASRRWGLPTWDKPAAACLSSRIAYGIEVTPLRLSRVERAESAVRLALTLRDAEVVNLRVRDLGSRARVEVDSELVRRLDADPALSRAVVAAAVAAGFDHAEIDSRGFRSGAMNEMLADAVRYR